MAISDIPSILFGKPSQDVLGLGPTPMDMWKAINVQEDFALAQAQQAQIAQIAGNAQQDVNNVLTLGSMANLAGARQAVNSGGITQAPSPSTNTVTLAARARELFLKRMGGIRSELRVAEGDFLQCHVYGEVVHVFYCFAGKPGVTQEQIDLFPSDTLITQFRIILAA
jgi:hypothetical protein